MRCQRAEPQQPQREDPADHPDGSIPADNPFHNAIWSYGHRNYGWPGCEGTHSTGNGSACGTSGFIVPNTQSFFVGTFGRLRTVEPTPDGNIWTATSNGGDKDSTPNNSNNRIFKVILGT
jgi:glucose/arabinose dehydrogenase